MGPRLCPAEARKGDVRATLFLCVRPLLEVLGADAHLGDDTSRRVGVLVLMPSWNLGADGLGRSCTFNPIPGDLYCDDVVEWGV